MQMVETLAERKTSLCQSGLETFKPSSDGTIPQNIIDVVLPVRTSNEVREATYTPCFEEAITLLQG